MKSKSITPSLMARLLKLLLSSFLLVPLSTSATAKWQFVTEDLPPLQIVTNGKATNGAAVEVVKEAIKRAKIDANIKLYPWARAFSLALKNEDTLIFSMRRNKEREHQFVWISPIYPIDGYFAKLKSRKDIVVKSPDDFKRYTIGTRRADYGETMFKNMGLDQNLYLSTDHYKLWKLLFSKKLDLVFCNKISTFTEFAKLGLSVDDIEFTYKFENEPHDRYLYLAANKGVDKEVVERLSKAMDQIKLDGTYQKIINKYGL